jgi:hypothetical protein
MDVLSYTLEIDNFPESEQVQKNRRTEEIKNTRRSLQKKLHKQAAGLPKQDILRSEFVVTYISRLNHQKVSINFKLQTIEVSEQNTQIKDICF